METVCYDASRPDRCLADWWPGDEGKPPVLLIHGGGWVALDRTSVTGLAEVIAGCGHAVLNIDYRLAGEAPWPACLDDCVAAGRFLLQQVPRILIAGASAGGHLALMAARVLGPAAVAGVLSISGITKIRPDLPSSQSLFSAAHLRTLFGHDPSAEECLAASPADLMERGFPPVTLIHSDADELVPISHARDFADVCRACDVPVRLVVFHGEGGAHGLWATEQGVRSPVAAVREALQLWLQDF